MGTGDPLRRMAAYQLSLDLLDLAWPDAQAVRRHSTTRPIGSQLYRAAGSIGANISEGYYASRHVLAPQICESQSAMLSRICRILLAAIPEERDRAIRASSKASGEP
jgi:hypothetical protein